MIPPVSRSASVETPQSRRVCVPTVAATSSAIAAMPVASRASRRLNAVSRPRVNEANGPRTLNRPRGHEKEQEDLRERHTFGGGQDQVDDVQE
jgi:hypothetical protein